MNFIRTGISIVYLPYRHLQSMYVYADFIRSQIAAVRKANVQGHVLGAAWYLLAPLLEMSVYFLLLAVIFKQSRFGEIPAFHGILVGLIHFRVFQFSVLKSINAIVNNRDTMLQVKVVPMVFVAIEFLKQIYQTMYYIPILIISFIVFDVYPDKNIIWYPFVIITLFIASWGCALFLSCGYVYLRDLNNAFQSLVFPLLYSSPVIYPIIFVPDLLIDFYFINPFATLFTMVQACFLGFPFPPARYILFSFAFFISILYASHIFYERNAPHFTKIM